MCQANLFAGGMEIEVRFDRVSVMAIQKKKVAGRSKSRKTNSAWRYHKKSMMLISMILVLLVGVLAVNAVSLRSRNAQYKKQEAELEAQIKEEKKRAKEVEAYEAYVKTDDFQAGKIVTIRKRSSGKFLGLFACSNITYIRTRRTSP